MTQEINCEAVGTIVAVIQAVSTVVLVAVTIYYACWTKKMAQAATIPKVRLVDVRYDVVGDDKSAEEGWFATLENNGNQRALVRIVRLRRAETTIFRLWKVRTILGRSEKHVIEPGKDLTILLDPKAEPENEEWVLIAQSPTRFQLKSRWRFGRGGHYPYQVG